jgi:2-polyprenyl-3-methyl-5-hydroxy-6-metoxy-1,4-benzoquinol methylase
MEQKERWDRIWEKRETHRRSRIPAVAGKDIIYRTVCAVLRREIPDARGKKVLEPGSGQGLVSLGLAKRGAEVSLLDISEPALTLSRACFMMEGFHPETHNASILAMPMEDDTYDVTWNGGVIEHFEEAEQVRAVSEMLRVTKPDGKVVIMVPSADARIYRAGKAHADRLGLWQPGYEMPISTLKGLEAKVPGRLVKEYRMGFIAELHFLKYYFAGVPILRVAWLGLVELMGYVFYPWNFLPGYLLVSVFKKED